MLMFMKLVFLKLVALGLCMIKLIENGTSVLEVCCNKNVVCAFIFNKFKVLSENIRVKNIMSISE